MAESTSKNEKESKDTPGNGQQDKTSSFLGISSKEGSFAFNFIITSAAAKIVVDGAAGVTKELGGDRVVEITKIVCSTTVKLAAIYTAHQLLKPLIHAAIEKSFGKKVESIKPGSLHVVLRCFTDKRFLEVLADYKSGKTKERLQIELSKIGIEVEGLKIEIENMKEVEKTKADIEKRARGNFVKAESFSKHKKLTNYHIVLHHSLQTGLMAFDFMLTTGKMLVRMVLNSAAVEVGFAVADATTALTDAVVGVTTAFISAAAAEATKVVNVDTTVKVTKSIVSSLGTLAVFYVTYKLLKPLVESAVRKSFGGERDNQEVSDIKPG